MSFMTSMDGDASMWDLFQGHSCERHIDYVWAMKAVIERRRRLMTWVHSRSTVSSRTAHCRGVLCISFPNAHGLQAQVVLLFLDSW